MRFLPGRFLLFGCGRISTETLLESQASAAHPFSIGLNELFCPNFLLVKLTAEFFTYGFWLKSEKIHHFFQILFGLSFIYLPSFHNFPYRFDLLDIHLDDIQHRILIHRIRQERVPFHILKKLYSFILQSKRIFLKIPPQFQELLRQLTAISFHSNILQRFLNVWVVESRA